MGVIIPQNSQRIFWDQRRRLSQLKPLVCAIYWWSGCN